ncbi:MAG: DUF1800 family protein [Gammaproteobacteria bacterium]
MNISFRGAVVVLIWFATPLAFAAPSPALPNLPVTDDGTQILHPDSRPLTRSAASRFLKQATFGPTRSQIDELVVQNNLSAWIDEQMVLPVSTTLPYVQANSNGSLRTTRHYIWWHNVMRGEDQLRQRVAFALSQIFVISDLDYSLGNAQFGVSHYYDMLGAQAFGNYRDLLDRVARHPTMGIYLSMVRNRRAEPALNIRPDENFAREILQLFSVGLTQLAPDGRPVPVNAPAPTYTQDTVEAFARVFTGWNFADSPGTWVSNDVTGYDKTLYMVADYNPAPPNAYHDTQAKTLLDGASLPDSSASATPAEDDLAAALDNIFNHRNVGPFFGRLLIQRLTTSNPSPAYVSRVAARFDDNGSGVRGDLGAVVKAILLDPEARHGRRQNADFGKAKEPIMRLTQLWRALDAVPGVASEADFFRTYAKPSDRIDEILGQAVMRSPSVFNFYLPDHPLPGAGPSGRVAPEMQILTEANVGATNNMLFQQIYTFHNRNPDGADNVARVNIDPLVAVADDVDRLIEDLNTLLLAGGMPVAMRATLKAHLLAIDDSPEGLDKRALDALFLIAASPLFMVQH